MNQIYLLQNQDKRFLSKQNDWVDGREPGGLYKTRHKDEALNQLFEVNAKDYSQRIHLLACDVKPNGLPRIDPEHLPPPMEKPGAAEAPSPTVTDTPDNEPADHQPGIALGD